MNHRLLLPLLLAAYAGGALAQYKCTAANGAITFQQTPCAGTQAQEKLVVVPNGHPPPASGAAPSTVIVQTAASAAVGKVETNADKRMLANYERQHRRDALEQTLRTAQDDKAQRATQRDAAIATARRQFGDDSANAAALRDALASIGNRYDALTELDESRIRAARAALDAWDKGLAAQATPAR